MIIKVESAYRKIEKQHKSLIKQLDKLSQEQLEFKPDTDSWSILQVCWHLIVAEQNSLVYMRKKVKGLDNLKKAGFMAKFRLLVLNTLVSTKLKFKAPAIVALDENATANLKYEDVKSKWLEVREDLRYFADKLDHKASEKLIFKHPILGMFNIYQAFSFMSTHVQHHLYQVERIKSSKGFPS